MAKLVYPDIIVNDPKYVALANLSNQLDHLNHAQIMTTIVELLGDDFIPLLAEKWSVTGYDGEFVAEDNDSKQALIRNAIELHRRKGTPKAIRDVLRSLGFGEIEIDEGLKDRIYENSNVVNIPADERWAHYAIRLREPVTNDQATNIRKIMRNFAPARCVLAVLDYKAVPLRYNKKARYNGKYNHGSN